MIDRLLPVLMDKIGNLMYPIFEFPFGFGSLVGLPLQLLVVLLRAVQLSLVDDGLLRNVRLLDIVVVVRFHPVLLPSGLHSLGPSCDIVRV